MSDRECHEARERVALGEHEAAAAHLAGCPSCRDEATALRAVLGALSTAQFDLEPSAIVDSAIRSRLVAAAPRAILLPVPAFVLSLAGLGAGFLAACRAFSAAGQGTLSGPLAAGVVMLYLALCAAAALPLLIHGVRPLRLDAREVSR